MSLTLQKKVKSTERSSSSDTNMEEPAEEEGSGAVQRIKIQMCTNDPQSQEVFPGDTRDWIFAFHYSLGLLDV